MVRAPTDLTLDGLSSLAVGIFRSADRQHHLALIYQSVDDSIRLSHLLTHKRFHGADAWDGRYFWSTVRGIDQLNRKILAARLHALSISPQDMSYGFASEGCKLVVTEGGAMVYVSEQEGKGLTCATFVLLVFESFGFNLIEREQWPARDEDREWQESILGDLKRHGLMTEGELSSLALDVGSIRYKPIEVQAASDLEPIPISFDHATEEAARILNEVAALRFKEPPPVEQDINAEAGST
jgi:hypothetical protein